MDDAENSGVPREYMLLGSWCMSGIWAVQVPIWTMHHYAGCVKVVIRHTVYAICIVYATHIIYANYGLCSVEMLLYPVQAASVQSITCAAVWQ